MSSNVEMAQAIWADSGWDSWTCKKNYLQTVASVSLDHPHVYIEEIILVVARITDSILSK